MKNWRRKLCFLLIIPMFVFCLGDMPLLRAQDETARTIQYTGILERNGQTVTESYLNKIVFDHNVTVKVKLELDLEKCTSEAGGHVQLALTKDEAHSHWMDDLPLYQNVQTSYEDRFSLYAGTYTFELHLIREEDAYVPFKVTIEVTECDTLPAIDSEATVWFKWGWDDRTIHKGKSPKKIDLYKRLGISSWIDLARTSLTYHSTNPKIATITPSGILILKRPGKVTLTVTLPNGQTATSKLRIIENKRI